MNLYCIGIKQNLTAKDKDVYKEPPPDISIAGRAHYFYTETLEDAIKKYKSKILCGGILTPILISEIVGEKPNIFSTTSYDVVDFEVIEITKKDGYLTASELFYDMNYIEFRDWINGK